MPNLAYFMPKGVIAESVFPENIHTPPRKIIENSKGVGVQRQ